MGIEVKDERPGCPACKYLQTACLPNCSLARHFPPESEPHFAAAKAFLGDENPAELVIQQFSADQRLELVKAIARYVTGRGSYSPAATSALETALCGAAIKRLGSRLPEADLFRVGVQLFGRRTSGRRGLRIMGSSRTTTSEAPKEDKSLASPDLDELLKIYEEPEVRRGGSRVLSPAGSAAMARIWDSFVEAMELPLPVAVMELQQSGVLPFDSDCDEPGPSDQDREEQKDEASSSGTKNEGGNNHEDTP